VITSPGPQFGTAPLRLRALSVADLLTPRCAALKIGQHGAQPGHLLGCLPLLSVEAVDAITQGVALGEQGGQFRACL
jgi:hypothetical protein